MKEKDYRKEKCTVYCDANKCNKTLDIDGIEYSEINYEMKENGWLTRKIYDDWFDFYDWYDFCSEECYLKTLAELKKKI